MLRPVSLRILVVLASMLVALFSSGGIAWAQAKEAAGSAEFTAAERKLLKAVGSGRRTGAFGTISVAAYGRRQETDIYIAVSDGSSPIPFVDPSCW